MENDDEYYYDYSKYCTSDRIEAADIKECKNGSRAVYHYACWDCGETGEPPYDGAFICRWCSGRLPYPLVRSEILGIPVTMPRPQLI